jgi:hypothetical protein
MTSPWLNPERRPISDMDARVPSSKNSSTAAFRMAVDEAAERSAWDRRGLRWIVVIREIPGLAKNSPTVAQVPPVLKTMHRCGNTA